MDQQYHASLSRPNPSVPGHPGKLIIPVDQILQRRQAGPYIPVQMPVMAHSPIPPSEVPYQPDIHPVEEVSLEPMDISDPSDHLLFPEIQYNRSRTQCVFCSKPLSGPRCISCNKVNYERMEFNRERFLSSKWECTHCHFRNVHSNQKCIECNSSHQRVFYR